MRSVWSKMPSRWIADGQLCAFRGTGAGEQAAALKLYMALAMFATFKPAPGAPIAGSARLSFSDLERQCDISRRYVSRGLEALAERQRLTVEKVGNAHRYLLSGYEDAGWAKLPRAHLLEARRFQGLGIRGALYLNALKLYLALITFRPNESQHTLLSYDSIEEYTGIPRSRIRRSIEVLVNHEWISIAAHAWTPDPKKPRNVYVLRGDFWGRQHQNYARASAPELVTSTTEARPASRR